MNIEAKETVHKKPHPPPSLAISPHKSSGRLKCKEARTEESNYRPHWRNPERVLQSQASREKWPIKYIKSDVLIRKFSLKFDPAYQNLAPGLLRSLFCDVMKHESKTESRDTT